MGWKKTKKLKYHCVVAVCFVQDVAVRTIVAIAAAAVAVANTRLAPI